ncbi:MAG TPA: zinc ribbon domain-containing protein [Longimicrobiales bacterium]
MRCPACQTESSGAYCPECGTPLQLRCKSCSATLPPGARFCTDCGARARASRANVPWYVAGVALIALTVVVLLPASPSASDAQAGPAQTAPVLDGGAAATSAAPAGDATSPPPLTGSPREQADRLFNLIMENKEKGDTAKAKFFVPMGIQAYGMAGDLDADGLYHLSLLQALGGDGKAALGTAQKILASAPDHLLGLVAAAEGATVAGDRASARKYYQHFLDRYDAEKGKDLPEYKDHSGVLPQYQAEAQKFLRQ